MPWRRERLPTPVFLPGEFHGQRSLAGYSQSAQEELDMTEWLTLEMNQKDYSKCCLVVRVISPFIIWDLFCNTVHCRKVMVMQIILTHRISMVLILPCEYWPILPVYIYLWYSYAILCLFSISTPWAFLVAQRVKRLPAMWETPVRFLVLKNPLDKEIATHCLENPMDGEAW